MKKENGTDTVFNMKMFKENLSEEELEDMRKWARENYKPLGVIKGVWHTAVQEECVKMNEETSKDISGLFEDFISDGPTKALFTGNDTN